MAHKRDRLEKILLKGFGAKLFQLGLLFGRNILIIPILLNAWGLEKYGLWVAIISLFDLLLSFDAGHSIYIANEFNRAYHNDKEKSAHILGSSLRIVYVSGLLQLLTLYFCFSIGVFDVFFKTELETNFQILIGLSALVMFRFLVGSARGILIKTLYPIGQTYRSVYLKSCERIIEIIILISAALLSLKVFETCILFAIFRILYSILALYFVKRWMPDFFPWWKKGDLKTGLRNYLISLSLTFNQMVDRFSKDGLNLVVSSVLGLAILPVFTTIRTLINFATQATNMVTGPLQPELVRFHASGHFKKIIESIKANWWITNLILNLPFILAIIFIGPLYEFWTDYKIEFNLPLYLLMAVATLLYNYGNGYVTYLKGINHIPALITLTITRSSLLLFFSWILMSKFGLLGMGGALVITELLSSVTIPYYFTGKKLAEHGYKIKPIDRILPFIAILGVSAIYLLYYLEISFFNWIMVLGIVAVLIISLAQWKRLFPEIKDRFIKLIPAKFKFNS